LVFRGNHFHDNYGDGYWTDINNINTLVEGNRFERNERFGVNHEIRYTITVRNNMVTGNGAMGALRLYSQNNHFDRNRYALNSVSANRFRWRQSLMDFRRWQTYGNDDAGGGRQRRIGPDRSRPRSSDSIQV
jgi:Right handed beta helix region